VLDRFKPDDLKTEMYLIKAYFRKGDYETCKKLILKLMALYP